MIPLQFMLRAYLATAVLWIGTPFAEYEHAHTEGQAPHSHSRDGDHNHCHEHGDPCHGHDQHDASFEWHTHIRLLGFDISLPGSEPDSDHSESTIAIALGQQCPPPATFVLNPFSALSQATMSSADAVHFNVGIRSSTSVISPPLCDIARHERSGVQLT